ncbi:agrin-like [Schistocerca nitens]|uniref:agrin-like n=1 Tax=Schistocerca nitens TaxID=7011 RepID=UPI00211779F9|nr:agrin-like [Schistocerca nitens]
MFKLTIHVTAASVDVRRLGSTCYADGDCALKNSLCHRGSCRCRNGLQPSHDGRRCLVYRIAAFDGESYIQLKSLKAYNKLNIEMEFISYANDGLLLYNQQKEDGIGDFVSLAIIEGYVEFRYDLGNGAAVLRSANRITLGTLHHVSARRYHRDGLLRLDAGPEVVGQSQGALRALDLQMDAFVGAVPTNLTRVSENVGAARGLVGCVQQLKLNQEEVRLHEGEPLVVRAVGVQECGANPCARLPCHNGGSCAPTAAQSFRCHCPPEFTGAYCEKRVGPCVSSPCVAGTQCEVMQGGGFTCKCAPSNNSHACQYSDAGNREAFVPEFNGSSYIELPRLDGVARAFALEIWFLTNMNDGILLYNSQQLDGKGDYIALVLISGHIQFHFNLGSGPANIRTSNRVDLRKWHSVKISRVDREGTLQLDDGPVARGTSGPPLTELNVELPLYIGGIP